VSDRSRSAAASACFSASHVWRMRCEVTALATSGPPGGAWAPA
jgi:hypothetical protein